MAGSTYEEKKYVESDAVKQAQQALHNQQALKPGAYQSQYQQSMNDLMGQIQGREKFKYDVNGDALYQQVAQNYIRQGQQAMMDTMGQAASLTGGYGNSYAQTAGQQAYQGYLQGLADLVPQYQQIAYQQYQDEGDDLLNRYNLMMQQDESAYARYQDDLNQYYADLDRLQDAYDNERDYDYGRYMDDLNYQYQIYRDQVADEQWQKEFDEDMRRYNQEWAAQRAAAKSSSGGGGGGGGRSKSKSSSSDNESAQQTGENITFADVGETAANIAASGGNAGEYISAARQAGVISTNQYKSLKYTFGY